MSDITGILEFAEDDQITLGYGFGDEVASLIDYMTHWGTGTNGAVGVEYRNEARDVDNYSGTPFWGTRGQQWDAGFIFIRPDLY